MGIKKKYLVTGAGGFIGAATATALLQKGAEVCTIDDFSTGSPDNVPPGVDLIHGRCDSRSVVAKLGNRSFDAIVHLAGQSSGEISFEDPVEDLRKNVESTIRLLEYSLAMNVDHFIYGSSVSTYGRTAASAVDEEQAGSPLSCYGVGKLASENYLRVFEKRGLSCTALRFGNVYGPGQNLQNMQQGMVSIYLAQLLGPSDVVTVKGSLERRRDFVFISDVVDAILLSICNPVAFGKTYNLGSGVSTSVRELVDMAQRCAQTQKRIVVADSTPGDQLEVDICIDNIQKDLNFSPKVGLIDGLKKTITSIKTLGNWWQSLETPNCHLCAADHTEQFVRSSIIDGGRAGQKFWQCRKCEVIYLYPPHSEEEEKKFYSHEFERFMGARSGKKNQWEHGEEHRKLNEDEKKRRLVFLEGYLEGVESCLEVGCSSGFMLEALKDRGVSVTGIEPSEKFGNYLERSDINTFISLDQCAQTGETFDLILHYFVLEHIRDPSDFLTRCLKMLNPDGVMIFEVPCASDPLIELYAVEEFEGFYWSVAHHWYFNQSSLQYLLARVTTDFKIELTQRYDLSNHMIWMRDGRPGGMGKFKEIFGTKLDHLYKRRLSKVGKCDTLAAVLRK